MRLRNKKKEFDGLDDIDSKIKHSTLESFNRSVGTNPLQAVMNVELKSAMDQAISELPAKFKSVFILKDVEGLSLKEISEMLDISLAAVKSNLHRARLVLRNKLAEYVEHETISI